MRRHTLTPLPQCTPLPPTRIRVYSSLSLAAHWSPRNATFWFPFSQRCWRTHCHCRSFFLFLFAQFPQRRPLAATFLFLAGVHRHPHHNAVTLRPCPLWHSPLFDQFCRTPYESIGRFSSSCIFFPAMRLTDVFPLVLGGMWLQICLLPRVPDTG